MCVLFVCVCVCVCVCTRARAGVPARVRVPVCRRVCVRVRACVVSVRASRSVGARISACLHLSERVDRYLTIWLTAI